jgi:hypothetical protein
MSQCIHSTTIKKLKLKENGIGDVANTLGKKGRVCKLNQGR